MDSLPGAMRPMLIYTTFWEEYMSSLYLPKEKFCPSRSRLNYEAVSKLMLDVHNQ